MVSEISTCNIPFKDNWLEKFTDRTYTSIKEFWEDFSLAWNRIYPETRMWVVRIYGKRWAFLTGYVSDISFSIRKIRINEHYGFCIDPANNISEAELNYITNFLREFLHDLANKHE